MSNKQNDFIYFTKLGLISTSAIQITHCVVTVTLIIIKSEKQHNFCQNNIWVMMRFLGLAVTLGFIFIGWRIEQSILNPLLNKQKRTSALRNAKKGSPKADYNKTKYTYQDHLVENLTDEDVTEDKKGDNSYMHRYSYQTNSNSASVTHNASAINDDTQANIKSKKKQLSIMWFIIYVILFIGFYEMVYSGVQRIYTTRDCNKLFDNEILDAILMFISRFIGLILWSWPLIYVYWLREYVISWRLKKKGNMDDEDEDDYYDPTLDNHKEGDIPRFILKKPKESSLDMTHNGVLSSQNEGLLGKDK